jgi:hypothetical protein
MTTEPSLTWLLAAVFVREGFDDFHVPVPSPREQAFRDLWRLYDRPDDPWPSKHYVGAEKGAFEGSFGEFCSEPEARLQS